MHCKSATFRCGAVICLMVLVVTACSTSSMSSPPATHADLILTAGRVYTLNWDEPALNGRPAVNAPHDNSGWHPDAQAVAIKDGNILFAGSNEDVMAYRGDETRLINLAGATVLPGLVDSHTHFIELGEKLVQVDLTDVKTEPEAVALVAARAKTLAKGQWILGKGWDEGAWANRYPDKTLLSQAVPDHPVLLGSLHGFAVWVNQMALNESGISAQSVVPVGGEMRISADGTPSGLFLNRATAMIKQQVPPPSPQKRIEHVLAGLHQMAKDGYVTVHDAGLDAPAMSALEQLEATRRLPIRVYAMLSLREEDLIREWIEKGPDTDNDSMLVTRSVKAFYDGALGSRGARLLEDYTDKPGHRGVSGDGYGFNQALNAEVMKAGFQVGIHAIGDAGNRETLDILEQVIKQDHSAARNRHRIEHAQIIHPDDIPRFGELGIIASMEPPHAMEDKTWAVERLGEERLNGAYAWRSLRLANAKLTFNADNPGSDHSIFYGLHSAITRQDKNGEPAGGWMPEQKMSIEEAVRGYTTWSAFAGFREHDTGIIVQGRWADITVMDIDPFALASNNPGAILNGKIVMTIVNGEVVYE